MMHSSSSNSKQRINLIIPAAGEATRLRPLSSNTSKVMVRVNGKPCLDYIIEQASRFADLANVVIVDGKLNDIRTYVESKGNNNNNYSVISFVNQPEAVGPHDAIFRGLEHLHHIESTGIPVVIWLGDAIVLDEELPLGTDFLLTKQVDDHFNWCVWDSSSKLSFYNKPPKNIEGSGIVALVGIYSFRSTEYCYNAFKNTKGSYDISDALTSYQSDNDNTSFISIETDSWYDIGNLKSYNETCASLLSLKARTFNSISYNESLGIICKKPDYHSDFSIETLKSEIMWYHGLTMGQSCFVPKVLSSKDDHHLWLSRESGSLLSDLMLYDTINESTWEYILTILFEIKVKYFNNTVSIPKRFLKRFSKYSSSIWIDKTVERLIKPSFPRFFSEPERSKIIGLAQSVSEKTYPIQGMHGDLHSANIIYDYYSNKMTFIDPRGNYGGYTGSYGDQLYDWCKLAHDLYHGYGAMVANVEQNEIVKHLFVKMLKRYQLPVQLILDGGIVLLATCIPLHYDDRERQERFAKTVKQYLTDNLP